MRRAGAKTKKPAGKRTVEMPGLWKEWKAKGRLPTLSTSPLEISPRAGEISHIFTAPAALGYLVRQNNQKRIGKCGRWKSGNPTPGFPLSHRPDSLRQQGRQAFTQEENRAVFGGQRLIVVDREK
jgi:hypothetical protein